MIFSQSILLPNQEGGGAMRSEGAMSRARMDFCRRALDLNGWVPQKWVRSVDAAMCSVLTGVELRVVI